MAEELLVVLNRSENSGFGFSLLGEPGLPPIIYNILDDSPAAESGEVEVGDVILKVNETDVLRHSTKEVLKCLRLSADPVTLKIKRDPKIKATVRKHLLSVSGGGDIGEKPSRIPVAINSNLRPEPAVHKSHQARLENSTNGSFIEQDSILSSPKSWHSEQNERLHWQPLAANDKSKPQPKFEAYMMTGEHILNISRVPQTAAIVPKQQKKVDTPRYHNSHAHHLRHQTSPVGGSTGTTPSSPILQNANSVPNSPDESDLGHHLPRHQPVSAPPSQRHASVPNSPDESEIARYSRRAPRSGPTSPASGGRREYRREHQQQQSTQVVETSTYGYVRTSRSEDRLQGQNDLCSVSVANSEADEDMTSSLNTLLDTRPDSTGNSDSDRIVWTYNAPITDQHKFTHTLSNGSSSSHSNISPTSSSPPHSGGSPASPTSVSSSVMSSQSGHSRRQAPYALANGPPSTSEAVSNISSPDYRDDDDSSMVMRDCMMEISDHSDSDSTLLVSEPRQVRQRNQQIGETDHRIVIQVMGPDKTAATSGKQELKVTSLQSKNEVHSCQTQSEIAPQICMDIREEDEDRPARETASNSNDTRHSPLSSEDESDADSLHSFHYSPKAVDVPSAIRLAKRLYSLDGFKRSDVSRHLSKNNDFSRAVAEEYLKYFDFEKDTLDIALRKFLKQFSLTGETQERERVLVHFSKRYLDCNPGSFNSQDAVHTLTCAIMLLNTDLHGQNIGRKMTCNEFIENLAGLNECENFPREVLKQLYHAIKNYPLEWALDEENEDGNGQSQLRNNDGINLGGNPFLDVPISANAIEYKKGYVMRKCCYEANAKRTPFHKRSWKMFYCTLRDLVLYLHKDENGFRKNQMGDNLHNAIRIHHALATKASDYTKKQYVFRLQTADEAEYLFQTSDSKELQSWIDTINFVCASFSAPPLEAAVGSQKKFQRPLLPCSHTKLNLREQLADHEERVMRLEAMLDEHRRSPPEKGSKSQVVQNYKEKEAYLNYELKRYRMYAYMLRSRISQYLEPGSGAVGSLVESSIGEADEANASAANGGGGLVPPPLPERPSPAINRCSFTVVHIIYYPDEHSVFPRKAVD